MKNIQCCVVSCEKPLDQAYWDAQYQTKNTAWDLGKIAPPIKSYIDTLTDKSASVFIPGCGNTYEAEYLLEQGFTNVTVIDIAPTLVENLKKKFENNPNINSVLGDFFEHTGSYDLILEQTFFCALPPTMRQKYVYKMHQLLADKGIIAGLLFDRFFENSPPFGGSQEEYSQLFATSFNLLKMSLAQNSVVPRANSELFIELQKNSQVVVNLYKLEGITCSGCKNIVSEKLAAIENVIDVNMSSDFSEVLIVSQKEITLERLQNQIVYDLKYKINKTETV